MSKIVANQIQPRGGDTVTVNGNLSVDNVSIAGTITYEDVTSVDSIGIITARSGIDVTGGGINVVGVTTSTSFDGDGSNLTLDYQDLTIRSWLFNCN